MLGAFGFRRSCAVGYSFNFKLETVEVLPRAFLGDLQQIDDFTCETVGFVEEHSSKLQVRTGNGKQQTNK